MVAYLIEHKDHDELGFWIKGDENEDIAHWLGELACKTARDVGEMFNLNIPIEAACKVGFNWCHCH